MFALQVLEKKERAEKLLAELEEAQIPQQPEIDKEGITEEERYMLRKVGLRMKPFLLLGAFFHTPKIKTSQISPSSGTT